MLPRGDILDEMIGQYIHQANCPVPIKKLGNGYYIFGTRKIYAKILNGKLVIRVGGGYMIIEEFINTYAEQELTKMTKIQEQQQMLEDLDDVESLDIAPAYRNGRTPVFKKFHRQVGTQRPPLAEEPSRRPPALDVAGLFTRHRRSREQHLRHLQKPQDQSESPRSY